LCRSGKLNCLGCFLWVDLGMGEPHDPAAERSADQTSTKDLPSTSQRTVGDSDSSFASCFPFGDHSLVDLDGRKLNDFSTLCCDDTLRNGMYASNWQNVLLLLPKPTHVCSGDRLRVVTRSEADSLRPSYRFDATLYRAGCAPARAIPLVRLNITFDDLYPDYGDL